MPHLFWVEREWHGDDLKVEVRDTSPLPLRDPAALRALTQPRHGPLALIGLFLVALIGRAARLELRRRLRRRLGRSYL
jgi:hypothetical protein